MGICTLLLLIFIAKITAADSPCREINNCIRPVEKYNTVFDLLPWHDDIPSLCNDASGLFRCLQDIPMSECHVFSTESYANLKKQAVSTVCSSDAQVNPPNLLKSKCATNYNDRSKAHDEVLHQCSGMARMREDETKCSMADKLKECIKGALSSSCGSEFAAFFDQLWTASGDSNGDCEKRLAYAYSIYTSYTPIIL